MEDLPKELEDEIKEDAGSVAEDFTGVDLHEFKLPPTLGVQWPKGHSALWKLIYNEVGDYVEEVGTSLLTALGADVVETDRRIAGTSERHFEMKAKWPNGDKHILDEMRSQVQEVETKVDKLAQQMKHMKGVMAQQMEEVKGVMERLLQKLG